MKISPFWATSALLALLHQAPTVLAADATTTSPTTPSSASSAAPTCTASEIAKICDYKKPGDAFAVASSGKSHCWEYCNKNQPCDFVIFVAGNPYTGTGTCWLYPGETYDASAASSDCGNPVLSVFSKPECSGGDMATPTQGACEATVSPSAVAAVCGYPVPDTCFETCYASNTAADCLHYCAAADECSYALFIPANRTCWTYTKGEFNPDSTTQCEDGPEQIVYKNTCPKALSASPSSSSLASGAVSLPVSSGGSAPTGTGGSGSSNVEQGSVTTNSENVAPTGLAMGSSLAVGMAVLLWQGL